MPRPPRKQMTDGIPKPKSLREVPPYLKKKIEGFSSRLFYIITLVWETAPLLLLGMMTLCVADGVLPIVGAYIGRDLINEIAALIGADAATGAFETFKPVFWLLVWQLVYLFGKRVVSKVKGMITSLAGELVSNHIKVKIITKAKAVDQASFDDPAFYEKLENANRESGMRPVGILSSTLDVISAVINVVSFAVVLATLTPWAPVVIVIASVPGAVINYLYRNKNYWYLRWHSKERRQMNYYSSTMVNKDYAKEVKILGLGDTLIDKYNQVYGKYYTGLRSLILKEGASNLVFGGVTVLAQTALFAYVAYRVVFEGGQIGDYSLYTGALTSISSTVATLVTSTASIYEGTLFIDNLMTFMKTPAKIADKVGTGAIPEAGVRHTIEFHDVSFRYPGTDVDVLKHVNLSISSGEHFVLVGLNGAGKTTLIKLMTRLYDPTEGYITLDGVDLCQYDPAAYYKLFGIIFQDFGKYSETAAENIRFGDVDTAASDERIKEAGKRGNADAYISSLPLGYETPLTRVFDENGLELSGGQWQKLSIARAFYKKSDILILDEPTAALDPLAEADVYRRFEELSRGKIAVFVSHRLSSAVTASQIIVMEHGEIIERGTHEELMRLGGKYHLLFSTQASRYLET